MESHHQVTAPSAKRPAAEDNFEEPSAKRHQAEIIDLTSDSDDEDDGDIDGITLGSQDSFTDDEEEEEWRFYRESVVFKPSDREPVVESSGGDTPVDEFSGDEWSPYYYAHDYPESPKPWFEGQSVMFGPPPPPHWRWGTCTRAWFTRKTPAVYFIDGMFFDEEEFTAQITAGYYREVDRAWASKNYENFMNLRDFEYGFIRY